MSRIYILLFFFSLTAWSQKGEDSINAQYMDELFVKGEQYISSNSYEEAIAVFDQILQLDSVNISATMKRGISYFGLKKYDDAVRDFSIVLEKQPEKADIYFMRGISRTMQTEIDKEGACEDFEKAQELGFEYRDFDALNKYCGDQ